MFDIHSRCGITYYTSSVLEKAGVPHFFATRFGGVSFGDFESLNVSLTRKDRDGNTDSPANVLENYRRALCIIGSEPEKAFAPRQIHSSDVECITSKNAGFGVLPIKKNEIGFDGAVVRYGTQNVDTACVKTADCVPILLADKKTGDVAAVHAGWRGTVGDIVSHAVQKLAGDPADIVCAIGPCIGVCCYEVGEEVYSAAKMLFYKKGIDNKLSLAFKAVAECSVSQKRYADLAKINQLLLAACGVKPENIDVSGLCTCCALDEYKRPLFFSHRASGGFSGTFVSAVKTFEPEKQL